MRTLSDIANRIYNILNGSEYLRTEYITVYSVDGDEIRIRVGNHSGNKRNNKEAKTLSFVSKRTEQRESAYNAMQGYEWEVDLDRRLTDTHQTIEQVLEWEDVSDDQPAAEELYWEKL